MTAEKGEHERAPRAGESYPTSLRATLRAPPSKWAIEAFFPAGERSEPRSRTARRAPADRSPRREAGRAASGVAVPLAFFGTFFRFERKYYPSRGGSPTVRAVVGASIPNGADGMRLRAHQRAFRSPFGNLRAPKLARNPWNGKHHSRAVVGASSPRQGLTYNKVDFSRCLQGAFR